MQRRSATPQYYFSDDYYVELLAGLGSDLLLCEVRDHDAEVVSSCLLMRHAGFLHYHLAGSDPDGAVMGSNNLMMWTTAELAFDQGLGRLHLGGGAPSPTAWHGSRARSGRRPGTSTSTSDARSSTPRRTPD